MCSHQQASESHVTLPYLTPPSPYQAMVNDGYISYHQAIKLGFLPTPHHLYTFIVTTIRDVHHPDALNVAYLVGWVAAHYEAEQGKSSIGQHLHMAMVHLRLATALAARKVAQP